MATLNIEKILLGKSKEVVYEFVIEDDNQKRFMGVDDTFQYNIDAFLVELLNIADNTLYSNRLFNNWEIKLFEDLTDNKSTIQKSKDNFYILNIINDKKGNIIFHVRDPKQATIYFNKVTLLNYQKFIENFKEFHNEPHERYNYYHIDKILS